MRVEKNQYLILQKLRLYFYDRGDKEALQSQLRNKDRHIKNLKKEITRLKSLLYMQDVIEFMTKEGNRKRYEHDRKSKQDEGSE